MGVLACLVGCQPVRMTPAPIVNGWHQAGTKATAYQVREGDNIYSIAWRFDLDFQQVADWNHLKPPYDLEDGQSLMLAPLKKKHIDQPSKHYQRSSVVHTDSVHPVMLQWQWPVAGKIVRGFKTSGQALNKGIDIATKLNQLVHAAGAGEVVYAGNGLRRYGYLIIIKHNANYLSAYGYNRQINVHVGQHVKAGQVIAKVGRFDGHVRLHFEIRKNGLPVNPVLYLKHS